MLLSLEEKHLIVDRLPDVELCYDNILHKKVHAKYFLIIPTGKKALLWFTGFKSQSVCFVLELDSDNNITHIYTVPVCFRTELAFNTVLQGTLIKIGTTTYFTCEDVLFYKNKNLQSKTYSSKLGYMRELFETEIKNTTLFKKNFLITLPVIKTVYNDAYYQSQYLAYPVSGIQLRTETEVLGINLIKTGTFEAVFKIKADIKQDIYNLYCVNARNPESYCGIAMIPDYKTSVFMNGLFRTIKENINLDFLEESDDDEEFENIAEDKFVDLTKTLIMKCVYMAKFKKWKPLTVLPADSKIITKQELNEIINRQTKKYR